MIFFRETLPPDLVPFFSFLLQAQEWKNQQILKEQKWLYILKMYNIDSVSDTLLGALQILMHLILQQYDEVDTIETQKSYT